MLEIAIIEPILGIFSAIRANLLQFVKMCYLMKNEVFVSKLLDIGLFECKLTDIWVI